MRAFAFALLLLPALARAAAEPEVALDPRVEALGIVQLLSGKTPEGFRAPDVEYVRRARKAFARFKDHRAVALTAALAPAFDYRHRTDVVLRRGPLPALAPRRFTPDYLVALAGGKAAFDAWLEALGAFAAEADVAGFVRDNAAALDPGYSAFRADVARRRYMEKLERSAGARFEGVYAVHPSVFHLRGSQVNTVVRLDDGGHEVDSVVGADVENGAVDFRPDDFVATAGHEISHGLLDPAGDLSRERIGRSAAAYAKLPWNCYGDWLQCVKETVVRAHMLRLVEHELGPESAKSHLEQEGPAKWPWLQPMAEKLAAYEKDRARWPDLYAYYGELLSVLPEQPARASTAAFGGAGPGPEWLFDATLPFGTPGQRAYAGRVLERRIAGEPKDAELRLRRAALRLLASDAAGAEKDAAAAAALAPSDPAAPLALGLALRAQGRTQDAAASFASALALCRAGAPDSARVACQAAARAAEGGPGAVGADPGVGPGVVGGPEEASLKAPAPAGPPDEGDYEFVVDPRVELLAEVLRSTGDAASSRLQAAFAAGLNPVSPAQLMLGYSDPPELARLRPIPYGMAESFGGEKGVEAFLQALRERAAATGFARRWADGAKERAALVARARDEARRTLRPGSVSGWLGRGYPSKVRFIVSERLPQENSANWRVEEGGRTVEVRMRSVMDWREKKTYLSFDDFGACPAHELTHTITDPLLLERSQELSAYSSLMIDGCTDNWTGCALEHMVLGVTLRALRAERGEREYERLLAHYEKRGFPYLRPLCERLAGFENAPARREGFAAFLPQAFESFRDALKTKTRARAAEAVGAQAVAGAAPQPYAETFADDARLELAVVLRRLAQDGAARAKEGAASPAVAASIDRWFAGASTAPAVALAAALEKRAPALPAQLLLHLSSAAGLPPETPVPPGWSAAAGGAEAAQGFLDAARAFAASARFEAWYASLAARRAAWLEAARKEAASGQSPRAAAEYLGRPLSGGRAFALVPLYPPSWPSRLAVYASDGARVLRPRGSKPGRGGAEGWGLDAVEGSTVQELVYEEAERLVPASPDSGGSIADACADRGGPAWPVCEREHLVAAVLLRLRLQGQGEAAYARALAGHQAHAWPYLRRLLEKLTEYESARGRWKDLASYWPRARLAFGAAPAPREADAPGVEFAADPRVELVSTLLRLGGGARKDGAGADAREADARFAPFAAHPAVAAVAAQAKRGGAALPLRLALSLGEPPALAAGADAAAAKAAGGAAAWEGFARELKAFADASSFWAWYDGRRPLYAAMAAKAKAESRYGAAPASAAAWLGLPLPGRARFVLAPLLPPELGTGFVLQEGTASVRVQLRPLAPGAGERFGFDSFGNSLVHELTHAATDPLVPEGFTAPGTPPNGCNDSASPSGWRACAQEYLVYGVTLRLLAAELGEEGAAAQAAAYSGRGFPRLPELTALLASYEKDRGRWKDFGAFAPKALALLAGSDAELERKRAAARKLADEGVAAYAAGDAARAAQLLARAERLDIEGPSASLSLGVALEKLGRREQAMSAYGRAIARALADAPRWWEVGAAALSSRATALQALGRGAEARADLAKARTLVPDDWPGKADLERRLKEAP